MLAPTNEYITSEYNMKVITQAFRALYKNRTFQIVKSTMRKQAETYHKASIRRKVFESLAWYALVDKKKKQERKELALI